ncbi:MAG: hypothetical protein FWD66_08715, partial [Paludibacter sp.]|nr:hypothetical protein [Paludibacter sp.]
ILRRKTRRSCCSGQMKSCAYDTVIAVNRGFNGYLIGFIEEKYKLIFLINKLLIFRSAQK